jgi:hypothetical protein
MIKQCILAVMTIACFCGARVGHTATDDNFYKGKTIRLIVAFSAGGGFTHDRASLRQAHSRQSNDRS